ncbi:peroxiredoxin [Mesonia hippocampi]|uniref:Peroxiredoxin n=1 Tax=Mesonia hippocampi TaxID=1628250 RepID=A0A840ESW4_9FLAO|nr:thioredoxin family protein [Mesonia hippocampi]MBB4120050.1 peroxiredoxin [Mesonia hippocampi]
MALTPSSDIPMLTPAPHFSLEDVITGKYRSLTNMQGEKGTVIMFICNHCPYVKHVNAELVRLANDYRVLGFSFIAISSNDIEKYPADAPDKMEEIALKNHYPFPYLFDKDQEVAKAYKAACTPDFYFFNSDLKLIYHGQLDDSRPQNGIPVTGRNLREALDAVLNNHKVSSIQKPSMGCNIKWKK